MNTADEKSTTRTPAEARRWAAAHADVKRSCIVSWPQAQREQRARDRGAV